MTPPRPTTPGHPRGAAAGRGGTSDPPRAGRVARRWRSPRAAAAGVAPTILVVDDEEGGSQRPRRGPARLRLGRHHGAPEPRRGADPRLHEGPGLRLRAGRPVRPARRGDGREPPQRRGVPASSSATGSARSGDAAAPAGRPQRAARGEPRPRGPRAPTTARCGARTPERRSRPPSTAATSRSSAAARAARPSAVFGGAQVLTPAAGQARPARRAHPRGPADGPRPQTLDRLHGRRGLPLRGPRRDRRGPHEAHGADRRAGRGAVRDRAAGAASEPQPYDHAALDGSSSATRSRRPAPTSPASRRTSRRSSRRCRPQYEAQFRAAQPER